MLLIKQFLPIAIFLVIPVYSGKYLKKSLTIFRGHGAGEAAASPNFRGLLKGNFNDFGKINGKKFSASPKKNSFRSP